MPPNQNPPKNVFSLFWLIDRFGVPLTILVVVSLWARPHIDNLIKEHLSFLQSAKTTQEKQAEILVGTSGALTRLEMTTDRSAEMIRDIHGKLIRQPVAKASPPADAEISPESATEN